MHSKVCTCSLPAFDPTACSRCMPEDLQDHYIDYEVPTGWVCPKCDNILAPTTFYCPICATVEIEEE